MSMRKPEDPLSPKGRDHDIAFENKDTIRVDFSLIPDHFRDGLAAATLNSVRTYLQQPGGREKLDKRIAARKSGSAN